MLPTHMVRGRQNPLHSKFPERLRKSRKAVGMYAAGLSEGAGLSQSIVGQLEVGPSIPRLPTVEKLARVLSLSAGWLAFGLGRAAAAAEPGPLRSDGLAERAREARMALGLSLREVSRRAETAFGAVRAIETGSQPSLDILEKIAGALAVSPAWLAFGEGDRTLARRRSTRAPATHTPAIEPQPATELNRH